MFIELEHKVINTDNIVAFSTERILTPSGHDVQITQEDYKKLYEALFPKPKDRKVTNNEPKSELLELFDKLHELTGGKGKAVFTLQREKKLSELLTKHRLTVENLVTAATNIGKDAFLQGDNDRHKRYGDVDYLLRPDQAARWSNETTDKKEEGGLFRG